VGFLKLIEEFFGDSQQRILNQKGIFFAERRMAEPRGIAET